MPVSIGRRELLAALGGAAAAWPLAARAQQASKLPTIGFLGTTTPALESQRVAAFMRRLRELGWIEGRNVVTDYRWAEGRNDRLANIAAEFVDRKVDVILTAGTPSVAAAKEATSVIPIVFAGAGDPVANNLVASLARPGGNVTGVSNQSADLAGKRLELLREVVPDLRRLAMLANAANPAAMLEIGQVETAARTLGLEVATLAIGRAEDIGLVFERLKSNADALYVQLDLLTITNRIRINSWTLGTHLPAMHGSREDVEVGV